jgi:primosomal protein N' (replication factor Y)
MPPIRVAVPVPGLDALTYNLPETLAAAPVGGRVLVPLGRRTVTGLVVSQDGEDGARSPSRNGDPTGAGEHPAVRDVVDVLDAMPLLPPEVVALAQWVAEYYACGIGDAVAAAMPPRAWVESRRYARISDAGHARLLLERGLRRTLLDALAGDRPVRVDALLGRRRGAHAALLGLERDGLLELTQPVAGSATAFRTVRVARITVQGLDVLAAAREAAQAPEETRGSRPSLGSRQLEALRRLEGAPEGLDAQHLAADGIPSPTLARLEALGLIAIGRRRVERDPFAGASAPAPRVDVPLTAEQARALDVLRGRAAAGTFSAVVLHGVTGSGKTELYLRIAADVVAAGRGALMLVPEIALTPAVAAAFRAAFGDRVAIQHSGLSEGERHDQWHRIRTGDVPVVVGTRSAVFAPLQRPGLILVDEEHDSAYKQEEAPRYHGRDVAVMRARMCGALAVLGSATPSLESYHNALAGKYTLITLSRRVLDRPMAGVRVVDMRQEYAERGPEVIVSAPLADAIRSRLERREQAIVLLNRRGFATSVFCRQCGATLECPNCSVTLTVHRAARRARCHYCNYAIRVPTACSLCAGPYLEHVGFGTERVESDLAALFPEARVARIDRDTIRRRGAITHLLEAFAAGRIDVLVGTQMIAKGHDFARVTLVGVVSADVGLGLADFRASERTFQLLTQVAGRAGRGTVAGEALIQTLHPDHYSIRHACRQDYAAFYAEEIRFRQSMRYPPAVALINAIVRAGSPEAALADAGAVVSALRWGGEPYRVLGPAPAPLSKLKGEHRAQLFLKGTHRAAMRRALLSVLEARPEIKRRTVVDVDPQSVL